MIRDAGQPRRKNHFLRLSAGFHFSADFGREKFSNTQLLFQLRFGYNPCARARARAYYNIIIIYYRHLQTYIIIYGALLLIREGGLDLLAVLNVALGNVVGRHVLFCVCACTDDNFLLVSHAEEVLRAEDVDDLGNLAR